MTSQQYQQLLQGGNNDQSGSSGGGNLGDNIGGAIGGTIGQVAGALVPGLDLTGASEAGLGAAGGALGQGLASLVQGQGIPQALDQGAQGALYGAIPGGTEMDLGKLGLRALTGAAGGAGAQAVQNMGQGQAALQANDLTSGSISGAMNALGGPLLSKVLGKAGSLVTGTAKDAYDTIAKYLVGDAASRDPTVRDSLVLDDKTGGKTPLYQQSINGLDTANTKDMNDRSSLLEGKTGSYNEFMDQVRKDATNHFSSSGTHAPEQWVKNIESWVNMKLSDEGINMGEKVPGPGTVKANARGAIPKGVIDTRGNPVKTAAGIQTPTTMLRDVQVPLTILQKVKEGLGINFKGDKPSNAKSLYSGVRQFIEDTAEKANSGDGKKIRKLNANYAKRKDAIDFIKDKQAKATNSSPMAYGPGWMARMGLTAGVGTVGGALGFAVGSPYTGGLTAIPFATMALKEHLMRNPEAASQYAKQLGIAAPVLQKALQQLGVRTPALTQQTQSAN